MYSMQEYFYTDWFFFFFSSSWSFLLLVMNLNFPKWILFDPTTQDAWKTTLLLRVKEAIKAKELEEDDLTWVLSIGSASGFCLGWFPCIMLLFVLTHFKISIFLSAFFKSSWFEFHSEYLSCISEVWGCDVMIIVFFALIDRQSLNLFGDSDPINVY